MARPGLDLGPTKALVGGLATKVLVGRGDPTGAAAVDVEPEYTHPHEPCRWAACAVYVLGLATRLGLG